MISVSFHETRQDGGHGIHKGQYHTEENIIISRREIEANRWVKLKYTSTADVSAMTFSYTGT